MNEIAEIEKLIDQIAELSNDLKRILMNRIFERKVIDFVDVAACYVKSLEKENKQKTGSISALGLMLASYCINDVSLDGKNARKHLYESGAFKGSVFGKNLEEEFNGLDHSEKSINVIQ